MNRFVKSNNLIILVRHGERMDRVGLRPTFHPFDSELTPRGKEQAFELGQSLSDYLQKNYPDHKSINIYSSPFARTIQTSKNIMKGIFTFNDRTNNENNKFNLENTININYYFSEVDEPSDFDDPDFKSFIVLFNKYELIEKEIDDTKLNYNNRPEGLLPDKFESYKQCANRLIKGLKDLVFNINNDNIQNNVFVIVSHAEPINQMNMFFGYPGDLGWYNIKYCNCYIYEYDINENCDNLKGKYIDSFYPTQK